MQEQSDEKLLHLNHLGLIPGPNEAEDTFFKRAEYCLKLREHLSIELKNSFAFEEGPSSEILNSSNKKLNELYDISPDWIPIFFSNYKLNFWHGGCAWIFQISAESPTAALIQLRQKLRHSSRYFCIYHRNELLTHELAHVGRMSFQEPQFEEMLAYNTADSRFRRWFGPILQSSTESVIFVLILFLIIVFDVFLISLHRSDAYAMAFWLKVLPVGMIVYALFRLWKKHKIMKSCLNNLTQCLNNPTKASAVLYRLKDKEIKKFASMTTNEIKSYVEAKKDQELRWKVIHKAYFEGGRMKDEG